MKKTVISTISFIMLSASAYASGGSPYGSVNERMSWDEIKDSPKVNIINEKISFGDALGRKISVFDVCKNQEGSFQSKSPRSVCDEADLVGRGQWRCVSSDYRVVKLPSKTVENECSSSQCDTRTKKVTVLGDSKELTVYSRGEGRQGPFHKRLFKKEYVFPACQ